MGPSFVTFILRGWGLPLSLQKTRERHVNKDGGVEEDVKSVLGESTSSHRVSPPPPSSHHTTTTPPTTPPPSHHTTTTPPPPPPHHFCPILFYCGGISTWCGQMPMPHPSWRHTLLAPHPSWVHPIIMSSAFASCICVNTLLIIPYNFPSLFTKCLY